ncbi:MAG: hypothetical protein GC160_13915 [Acidobacteria bacterium]|nr:hypothetical protein [Acidobacteriota bacterium]
MPLFSRLASLVLLSACLIFGQVVVTIAGRNTVPPADGTPATMVPFDAKQLAFDSKGRLLVPDSDGHVVYRFTLGRGSEVIAGNGFPGFSGDGGLATRASMNTPSGVCEGPDGSIYITEYGAHRVRKVDPQGVITTIAGRGQGGYSGDGGRAVNALIERPTAITTNAVGEVFFADSANNIVRKIDLNGIITTVAGMPNPGDHPFSGENVPATRAQMRWPEGVAFDNAGNLYISDRFFNIIRKVDTKGIITTFAGSPDKPGFIDDVPASQALLYWPQQIANDTRGGLVFADNQTNRIRAIDQLGRIKTIAGTGLPEQTPDGRSALQTGVPYPEAVAVNSSGQIVYADERRVRTIRTDGRIQTVAGTGGTVIPPDGVPSYAADLRFPLSVAVDNQNRLLIADSRANVVLRADPANGYQITRIAGTGEKTFSGDGGPAVRAALNEPIGLHVLPDNSILIADKENFRIRKIDPKGVITTIAGNGSLGLSQSGSPALQSPLNFPTDVAADTNGDVYVSDSSNHIIVKIDSRGTLTWVAGTGQAGYNGDGPATRAQLNFPREIAFDSKRNLIFADDFNGRVRRLTPSGGLETIAGNGQFGSDGDGGPGPQASFKTPWGVAVDSRDNIYIAESNGDVIRMLSAQGVMSRVAGSGERGASGDGGPALAASFTNPAGMALDAAGNLFVAEQLNNRVRAILASPPGFTTSFDTSGPIELRTRAGKASPAKQVEIIGDVVGLSYQASTSASWLQVSPTDGGLPVDLNVRGNAEDLGPGEYTARLNLYVPEANEPQRGVDVKLIVETGEPAKVATDPGNLTFGLIQGGASRNKRLTVSNAGTGRLSFTATATSEQGWLTIDTSSGQASAANPQVILATANPGQLAVGTYAGEIRVMDDQGNSVGTPVTMTISAPSSILTLSQAGVSFRSGRNGGDPLPQKIAIFNAGSGSMSWTASATTLSGRTGWLRISDTAGVVEKPLQDYSVLEISADTTGLIEGDYFGRVDVNAPGNPPETISVLLRVLAAGAAPPPSISQSALIFVGAPGVPPGSKELIIGNRGSTPLTYSSSRSALTEEGVEWFVHGPEGAVIQPNTPQKVIVNPKLDDLSPGIQRGSLSFYFEDGSIQNVRVIGIVAPSSAALTDELSQQAGCNSLEMEVESSGGRIQARLGEPVRLAVTMYNNCGTALTTQTPSVQAIANFTNGDSQVDLRYESPGLWSSNWQPRGNSAQNTTVTLTGRLGSSFRQRDIAVEITEASPLPIVEEGAVLNAASFESASRVSPGALISIFGSQLSDTTSVVNTVPLPTLLEGTEVYVAGVATPLLFANNGQINAQIPFNLPLNRQVQLLVKRGNALSVEERLTIAPTQPAIFTINQQGYGQGAIVDGLTFQLNSSGAPARVGSVLTAFCTGLGLVDPPSPEGQVAPDSPLSVTVNPVEVTVDGIAAQVLYSGLAPRFAGLYQINFTVPPGVLPGDSVPIQVRTAGLTSPPVTIVVR